MAAQSCASVPPEPAVTSRKALRLSMAPENIRWNSSRPTSESRRSTSSSTARAVSSSASATASSRSSPHLRAPHRSDRSHRRHARDRRACARDPAPAPDPPIPRGPPDRAGSRRAARVWPRRQRYPLRAAIRSSRPWMRAANRLNSTMNPSPPKGADGITARSARTVRRTSLPTSPRHRHPMKYWGGENRREQRETQPENLTSFLLRTPIHAL